MIQQNTKTPGIYEISAGEYHSDIWAVSSSMLKEFAADSLMFHKRYNLKTVPRKEPTPAMAMGTLVHAMLLEPDTVHDVGVVIPDDFITESGARSSSKAAKAWQQEQELAGLLTFKAEEWGAAMNAAQAAKTALLTEGIDFDGCQCEQSIYWQDGGLDFRCRLDIVPKRRLIVDLKVMASCHPTFVDRQVANLKHWLQQAHYIAGYRAHFGVEPIFAFLSVEPKEPHNATVTMLDSNYKTAAEYNWRATLNRLQACRETGDWRNWWARKINYLSSKPWTFEDYTEQGE